MLGSIRKLIKKFRRNNKNCYVTGSFENGPVPEQYNPVVYDTVSEKSEPRKDTRVEKKPVEVVEEILTEEPTIDLTNLNHKLRVVKRRQRILKEELNMDTRNENIALQFLKARQKYKKYKQSFNWKIATQDKINDLLSKYKLRQVDLGGFQRNVPNEALNEIEKFLDAWRKVSDNEPRLTLIIDDGGKETKKDPILLAPSPFGHWFYVLGAWDKEVEYVDELVYKHR